MTERNREREAAAVFARNLADPAFRKELGARGCQADQDVVITLDETPIGDVLGRVFTRCRPPALVAIRRESVASGFVFLIFAPTTERKHKHAPADKLHPSVAIGVIYDSMDTLEGLTFELTDQLAYDIEPVRRVPVSA